ncbi:PLAT domain-containing protein 3-like [Momordica charantia]|uniref:PLAT domain-containing protein 3-like n=1 Tax=Momordica charantia TaxID=3673 RepID=A0A6J1DZ35_MOMCH|nr:PLAT domain-containing protein 3-like [Momordica charantia]XP_022159543.1 PLAT domain-containing protein 3-like [Momordica charantia]
MAPPSLCFSIVFIALFLSAMAGDSHDKCVYTFYVRTGSILKGGTDSKISITLGDSFGQSVSISDLESWGLMGPGHDYFERDSVDVFSGRGACIDAPVCRLNLTSDGSGPHHGWYCDYVEVTSTGPHRACSQTAFYVDQWLATDVPPFQLTTILDGCEDWVRGHGPSKHMNSRRLVVSSSKKAASS